MTKLLKYTLFAAGGMLLIAVAGAAYLIATFDPNSYKPQLIETVRDKTQRNLKLDGDIKLTFFPSIGVSIGKVSLSEFRSEQEFVSLDHAHVALALWPLFSKQVVVEKVDIGGIKVQLVKHKDGKLNIDDLTTSADAAKLPPPTDKPAAAAAPIQFDIAAVTLDHTELSYRDEASGAQYAVRDLSLQTGRIANTLPSDVKLSARIEASQPRIDLTTRLNTRLTFDLNKHLAELAGLRLQINGSMADLGKLDISIDSDIQADLNAQQFKLAKLVLALDASGDKLPNGSFSGKLTGNVQLDTKQQIVTANMSGKLLQSQLVADANVSNFAKPAIRFNIEVDQFDADTYLPQKTAAGATPATSQAAAPEQPFDLSALRTVDLDGKLKVGALKAFNIKTSQLQIGVKARNGLVKADPLGLALYQGNLKGSVTVNAAPALPTFAVNAALSTVDIGPLAKDAANLDIVEGKGNVNLSLTTQGNLVSALKKKLNGSLGVNLADGAIKGINLPKLVQGMQSLSKDSQLQTFGVNKDEKTAFSEFRANFKMSNGVAHNDDLSAKAPMLHITGNGDIDIGNDSMNYTAKATVSKTEGGGTATLPVTLSGPFAALKYKVDFGALLADVAKQKLGTKVEEVKAKATEDAKAKAQEQLKEGLKGLFK